MDSGNAAGEPQRAARRGIEDGGVDAEGGEDFQLGAHAASPLMCPVGCQRAAYSLESNV
ncbi:hypothetical protein EDD90_1943 [Streptomyces sp. Ag109_O5-1]|nr:hypothetical protein EDD90_1943 [Streptomyces sp. Ag109_O5-1]